MRDGDWFFEIDDSGYAQGTRVRQRLLTKQTPFQRLEILESEAFGRTLVLDDALQTTERDEFMYHEMLVHVPLMTHPAPQRVLIIGGGDGGSLRRLLQHRVPEPIQVEIDRDVIDACKAHIPAVSAGAYDDPAARVIVGDGIQYMREHPGGLDVVIVDSTDPVGPAVQLFEEPFYQDVARSLADDGLMVAQSSSPLYMADELRSQVHNLRSVFPIVRTYLGIVMGYPGVLWSYSIGSKRYDPLDATRESIADRLAANSVATRYYTPDVHHAAFALPRFIEDIVS
ncbi:MAG: spermidine synthase [Chloroflexota bacterium]|nr:spermidine synthase [Chloroflexota bacterium]